MCYYFAILFCQIALYIWALIKGTNIFIIIISSWWIDPFYHYTTSLSAFCENFWIKVYFVWCKHSLPYSCFVNLAWSIYFSIISFLVYICESLETPYIWILCLFHLAILHVLNGGFNTFIFKVITIREGITVDIFVKCVLFVLYLFCPSFSLLMPSFVSPTFCIYMLDSFVIFLCGSSNSIFSVSMGIS